MIYRSYKCRYFTSMEFGYIDLPAFFCFIFTNCTMITTIPQVSYDDFVAAGSLGVAREKGLVKIFALLHLTFSDLKHVVKNMLSLLVYLICYFDCSWGWKERIMLCRKEMSCFSDSTCDNNSSKKLQNTGICTRQNIVCPYCDIFLASWPPTIDLPALFLFLWGKIQWFTLYEYHMLKKGTLQ